MISIFELEGVLFDMDDTMSDTQTGSPLGGLHERSRLTATHQVGKQRGIQSLLDITFEQNTRAFLEADVHTVDWAVWIILLWAGLVNQREIDPENKLLREIVALKDVVHEDTLRKEGREVPGASHFVKALAVKGLENKMAIASMAILRDINIFLDMYNLREYFPDDRIISKEKVLKAKPDPEVFNKAFESLKLPFSARQRVLALEDDPRGIASANAAGLLTCAITTRFPREHFGIFPNIIVDSYPELERLLDL